ncbi:MAG: FtsX-like permease family protein [Pirellulales bacterium]
MRTRFIALASVISVTLGVAALIIVNSVMDGFVSEMQNRMHGILSDIIIESHAANGLPNQEAIQQRIKLIAGDQIEGMTTVVHVPAMVSIEHLGETVTRQINLIGIDTKTYSDVSDFSKYLLHPDNQKQVSFALRESGYAPDRNNFPDAGWQWRRQMASYHKRIAEMQAEKERLNRELLRQMSNLPNDNNLNPQVSPQPSNEAQPNGEPSLFPEAPASLAGTSPAPTAKQDDQNLPSIDMVGAEPVVFDAEKQQHVGIVLGMSIGATRYRDQFGAVSDYYYVRPGDDVKVTFPSSGRTPRAIEQKFTVVDFYESKMSEYDSTFAFVPMDQLQKFRGMTPDAVSSIQLKLKAGADLVAVRDLIRAEFPVESAVHVNSWKDLQGALLAAVHMETTILNILLFLIIAVAGFGILAIFFMIVVEKTKDIGIMKSLGASASGVASIFLGYGVMLGCVGAGVGAVAGLLFVANINGIADMLEVVTGQEVFDPTIYYFDSIPTIVRPWMVVWVVVGAVCIAVVASVLPSMRAARMHPVEALRYE